MNERPLVVIIACGKAKVWDHEPGIGAVPAREAYSGYPFRVNRCYAEAFADRWFILSAKYGLLRPDDLIEGPYDACFHRRGSGAIPADTVQAQADHHHLNEERAIVVLGGRHYRAVVEQALTDARTEIIAPFAGLGIGKMVKATKAAVEAGTPFPTLDM